MSANVFESDRPWLSDQPGMNTWERGSESLTGQLNVWLNEYLPTVASPELRNALVDDSVPRRKLWACWAHHWQQAIAAAPEKRADGFEIASRIRAGQGGTGQLGSNPLRDVLLAWAAHEGDGFALSVFESNHGNSTRILAQSAFPDLKSDSDWWPDFQSNLVRIGDQQGKLDKFAGHCGLGHWLGTVVKRWALDRRRAQSRHREHMEELRDRASTIMPLPVADANESADCRGLLVRTIRDALGTLPAENRLVLIRLHADGRTGRQIAAELGINAGNVSRRKTLAEASLGDALRERTAMNESLADCVNHLFEVGGNGFGDALVEALHAFEKEEHK